MNLFFKSYRICLIFFLLITWEAGFNSGLAQESDPYLTPWIQEIKPPFQYSDIPNVSFYKDNLSRIFIGKANGLSILDGNRTIHLHLEGPVYVTGIESDTICYAAKNDIGFLLPDEKMGFFASSCNSWIDDSQHKFSPVQLLCTAKGIFMNSDRGVYYLKDGRSIFSPFKEKTTRLFMAGDEIYLALEGSGILKWKTNRFIDFIPEKATGDESAIFLEKRGDRLEIFTSKGGVYYMEDGDSEPTYKATFSTEGSIESIDYLNEEMVLVDDRETGLSIFDHKGRLINHLGGKQGLPQGNIRQIFACEDHNIWILAPYSLHKIKYPSILNNLNINASEIGSILTTVTVNHQVILGTNKGVFSAGPTDTITDRWLLNKLSGSDPESYHLLATAGTRIFAAGSEHLCCFGKGDTELISDGIFTGLQVISENSVIASNERGIFRFKRNGKNWKEVVVDLSLANSHSFVTHDNFIFFICNNGVYRLSRNLDGTVTIPFHMDDRMFRFIPLDRELYLVCNNRAYRYEKSEETFLPLPWDHKAEVLSGIDVLFSNKPGDYWMVRHTGSNFSRVVNTSDLGALSDDLVSFPVLQNFREILDLSVSDSILYITDNQSISLFDLHMLNANHEKVSFRIDKLTSDETGNLYLDLPASGEWFNEDHQLLLSHKNKKLEFSLAGMEFQRMPEPLFRYRLAPVQDQWTPWQTDRIVILDNLRHGEYLFAAQAKDLYGRLSDPAELHFSIKTPYYSTWYAFTIYTILFLIGLFLFQKWRLLSYQRAATRVSQKMQTQLDNLTVEKEKSDKLVAEIFPEKTAAQLKSKGKAKWDKYERATVLFSDIQGFTKIAEEMNPEALIDELDRFFFHFDSVVEKYNIEKIKTIGDAYMAAGGIPEKNSTNPVEVVLAALEMQAYMQHLKSSKADIWDLRIGIHTGPVIAGVVGHKKVSYDIWGDTVNTASRMESSGMAGKVNISGITYGMVKEYFICEYRGKLPVKYKGNIDMYFVNGLRPELSVDLKGIPNKRFFTKLQLLRLGDLEDRVIETILKELPPTLYFHRMEYALKVYNQSFLLCRSEEIEQEERLLVRTAALLLFTGFTQSYNNFENRSSVIVREILPDYSYSEHQIDQICNLILATKQPFNPNNQLEKILIDAKMEFIGRPDYTSQIKLLFKELKEAGSKINGQQFKKQQIELLYSFEFFTVAGKRLREVSGPDQMSVLEEERWI